MFRPEDSDMKILEKYAVIIFSLCVCCDRIDQCFFYIKKEYPLSNAQLEGSQNIPQHINLEI